MWSVRRSTRTTKTFVRVMTALGLASVFLTCLAPLARANDLSDGQQYLEHHQFQQAIDSFSRALEVGPPNAKVLNHRGLAFLQLGQNRRAILDFDGAIGLDPSLAVAYNNRGRARFNLKQYERAISDFGRAIDLDPKLAGPFNNRGLLYFNLNQYERAIADYSRAIALDPSLMLAFNNRGRTYAELSQYEKALPDLDRAIALDPSCVFAYANRSLVYARLNRTRESARDLAIAMKLDPNNDRVRQARTLLAHQDDIAPIKDQIASTSQIDSTPVMSKSTSTQQIVASTIKDNPSSTPQIANSSISGKLALTKQINNSPIKDKWALVIGISKFEHPEYNLKYAAKDAQDFYNYLIQDAHFQNDHVLLLLDDKATKVNILNAFGDKWLPNLCQEGDLAVVYVSTHGTPAAEDRGGQNYVVAYDTDADSLFATGVDMDALYGQIKGRIKTDRALIIMDTCYSGGGVPGSKGIVRGANFNASDLAQGCGHLVITSSSPNERSWESKTRPNGVFTTHLIEALKADGGKIDVKSAFEKAKQDVVWDVKSSYGESQTPQLGGEWEGSNLVLSAPATAPRPMPPDAQSFVIGDTNQMSKNLPPHRSAGPKSATSKSPAPLKKGH